MGYVERNGFRRNFLQDHLLRRFDAVRPVIAVLDFR